MVAYNMDFAAVAPSSGGGKNFPVSPPEGWLCMITAEETRAMKGGQGNMLVFALQGGEGAVGGQMAEYRLNLQHPKPETVAIAQAELAALGWVTGVFKPGQTYMADTQVLFGKPFRVIVIPDDDPRYTRIVGVRTADGQDPAKLFNGTANGPTHSGGAPQIGGGQAPGGTGGAPQGQAGGFGGAPQGQQPQGQQGGQQPQGQQGGGFGGAPQGQQGGQWGGAPQGGQPAGQQGGQAPQGQWGGAPAGGQPQGGAAPAGGAQWGGTQQGGGAPQWGQ